MRKKMKLVIAAVSLLSIVATAAHSQAGPKLPVPQVSEELLVAPTSIKIFDSEMAYVEMGAGEPVLFIHGNPTSSYLWRNVMPHVAETHRAIAVDLIGMGGSGKPAIDYTFADHYRYLHEFINTVGLKNITLVGHDWGATLAWEYARTNQNNVVKIAFMEGVLPPAFPVDSYEALGPELGKLFRALRNPEQGTAMVIDNNMFVEQILPFGVNRTLGDTARAAYRAPYTEKQSRLPTLVWPRELPIGGEPKQNVDLLENLGDFMGKTDLPVLLMYAEPGAITPPQGVAWFESTISNLETSFIGQGLHFIQEDAPGVIGRALKDWLRRH